MKAVEYVIYGKSYCKGCVDKLDAAGRLPIMTDRETAERLVHDREHKIPEHRAYTCTECGGVFED